MTAVLYAKRPFCDIFDEVSRRTNMNSVDEAIAYAFVANQINVHTTYKITMLETGESKVFSKNTVR